MVACEFAGQLDGGAPLLVGIFRHIHVPAFPAPLLPFFLAIELEADQNESGEHLFDLRLVDQDGGVLFAAGLSCHFRPHPNMGPSYSYFAERVQIHEYLPKAGTYRFDLIYRGEPIGQLRLEAVGPG